MPQIVFKRQIVKSGDSFQVVIPPEIFEALRLRVHQKVAIEPKEGGIFLRILGEVPQHGRAH